MLRAQFCVRTVTGFGDVTDEANAWCRSKSLSYSSASHLSFQSNCRQMQLRRSKSIIVCCKSSRGGKSNDAEHERDDDYIEAVILISETRRHYHMRMQGFQEEIKWQSPGQLHHFSVQGKDSRADMNIIGRGLLLRFQSPTIFLKISCDGDFLLPIIVGEFAVDKLINYSQEDEDCPNQFQLMRNIVGELGYEVKMVRIIERVDNIYNARIYFHKPGKNDILRVDARPSDAINVATRCRAPIFVNKQIVLTDAIMIVHGIGRSHDAKSIYDVSLDSAADGPDSIAEEIVMVRNMNLAIGEERYSDAAMWRDKLLRFRESKT